MKNTNQIRQLLKEAIKELPFIKHRADGDSYCLISKALALLPCKTCNGKETIFAPKDITGMRITIFCPDC